MSEFGAEMKRLRSEKGWSQAQLAVYSETSQPTVNQIETGKRNPSTETLVKLARALGVEVAELFPKASRRSLLEPSLLNDLEDERHDEYQRWLDFADRYAARWEQRIETGDLDSGSVREFAAVLQALEPTLVELGIQEKQEQPQEYLHTYGPTMSKVFQRLYTDLMDPLLEAGRAKWDNSDLEQVKRRRADRESTFGEILRSSETA